jgi:Fe-S cluster assembly iron-binding protein IscA
MALDEPKDEDSKTEAHDKTFIMAPDVESVVNQNGGLNIDYVDDGYRKGYTVNLGTGGGDCSSGSCGSGGCG